MLCFALFLVKMMRRAAGRLEEPRRRLSFLFSGTFLTLRVGFSSESAVRCEKGGLRGSRGRDEGLSSDQKAGGKGRKGTLRGGSHRSDPPIRFE